MPRPATCPNCRRPCPPPAHAGTAVRCPSCQASFVVGRRARRGGHRRRPRPGQGDRLLVWSWRLLGIAVFLLLLSGTLVWAVKSLGLFESRVTRENFERLAVGMKESEVRHPLGPPTWIDNSAVPRAGGVAAWRDAIHQEAYPRKFFWEDGQNVIWAEIQQRRVLKVGATLDGEQLGEDPQEHQPDKPAGDGTPRGD